MAILTGFPPSNTISPGVYIIEKDLSFVTPELGVHRVGLVGFASKGPIDIPTLIRTQQQLHTTYGFPHPESGDPYLIYAGEQYLTAGTELYVVRVGDTDPTSDEGAKTAEISAAVAGGRAVMLSDPAASMNMVTYVAEYIFADDSFFRWRLNGVLASKVLVVPANDVANPEYTPAELADTLNDQLDSALDGIEFFVTGTAGSSTDPQRIAVRSVFSYGPEASLEIVSVQDAIYGGSVGSGNVSGFGTLMTQASITGTKTSFGTGVPAGSYNVTTITNPNLQLVIDGTDNENIDDVVQVVLIQDSAGDPFAGVATIAAIVAGINAQVTNGDIPGGFIASASGDSLKLATLHHGRDAKILVKSDSTADTAFGLSNVTAVGVSPTAVSNAVPDTSSTAGKVTGNADTSGTVSMTIKADTPGMEGNNTQVVVTNDIREGVFTLDVYSSGDQVESWGNLVKDETSRFYVETFLALVSNFITVNDNVATEVPPLDGTYSLSGGSDGIPSDPDEQDTLIIGNDVAMTGLQALSESEQIDIDLLAVPGHSSTGVIAAMLDICQNKRRDCFAIIDPPFGLTAGEVTAWQNGTHTLNSSRFDSDFGALYWPWVKVRDTFNNVDVWVPPSGSVLATIARSDNLDAPWFAPAGTRRGVVLNILDVFSRPSLTERHLMYGNRNAINPIIQFVDAQSFVIWGNKTLKRNPTALDRINVRRMMLLAEKRIQRNARVLVFEPHDAELRNRFIQLASAVLTEIQVERGINDFIIKCDEELNPPEVVDRNELRARIGIQPIRAAEFIFIEFSVHRTGSFTENADTF